MAADPVVAGDRTVSTSSISSGGFSTAPPSHTGNDAVPIVSPSSAASALHVRKDAKQNSVDAVVTMKATDLQSDATANSSERSSSVSSEDEEGEEGEFGCDEYGEDDNDACDASQRRFLLKPMPTLLQVCPVDDLAVEEEKRRRRHSQRNNSSNSGHGKGKNVKRTCADAESLPSAPSPLLMRSTKQGPGTVATTRPRNSPFATGSRSNPNSPQFGPATPTGGVPPQLRRDSMAIRQQYWKQLGFNLTRSDLERTTGRKKERQKGLKVRLNDAPSKKGESKNFFQFIASWYGANNSSQQQQHGANSEEEKTASAAAANGQREHRSSRSSRTTDESASAQNSSSASTGPPARKTIHFNEEAELFYIPLYKDYSKRQRDCMWHTRVEFISMVERNLEDVYEEMEREYEEQLEAEYEENEAMAREEARQRKIEAGQKALEASKAKAAVAAQAAKKQQQQAAAAAAASIRSRSPSLSPSTRGQPLSSSGASASAAGSTSPGAGPIPIPTLSLCPIDIQIKLAPRGRSTHDIRFKYLKHLGIQNT
jgi:hypothetical protein